MIDLDNFKREAVYLNELMAEGVYTLQFGSYADRHPGLGKMVKCHLCGRRRREIPLSPCCNTGHATTQRAYSEEKGFHQVNSRVWNEEKGIWEDGARVNESPIGKGFFKRFQHKRHSNKFRKQLHDLILQMTGQTYELPQGDWIPTKVGEKTQYVPSESKVDEKATQESRERAEAFRNTTQLCLEGLQGFHEPQNPVPLQNIPAFAEQVLRAERKNGKNRKRKYQKLSRRINFGLI